MYKFRMIANRCRQEASSFLLDRILRMQTFFVGRADYDRLPSPAGSNEFGLAAGSVHFCRCQNIRAAAPPHLCPQPLKRRIASLPLPAEGRLQACSQCSADMQQQKQRQIAL